MESLAILQEAERAGLKLHVEGDKLVIQGPRKAEPIVRRLAERKAEVMAALTASAADWRARHREALAYWGAFHPAEEASSIAWGEMENLWHKRHGKRVLPGICSGCGRSTANTDILSLGDGTGVHICLLECVIAYGDHWRGAATKALVALGLMPPQEKT